MRSQFQAVRRSFEEHKSKEMDKVQQVHRFASNYTAIFIMIPFAASACTAVLETWFNLQGFFMFVSEILMFIGFIEIVLVRMIYGILVKKKKSKLDRSSAKLKTGK